LKLVGIRDGRITAVRPPVPANDRDCTRFTKAGKQKFGFREAGLDPAAAAGETPSAAVVARPNDPTRGCSEKWMAERSIEVSAGGGNSDAAIGRRLSVDSLAYRIESSESEPALSE
jgi:hypothetical protein